MCKEHLALGDALEPMLHEMMLARRLAATDAVRRRMPRASNYGAHIRKVPM